MPRLKPLLLSLLPLSSALTLPPVPSQEHLSFSSPIHQDILSSYTSSLSVLQDSFFSFALGNWPSGIDWTTAVLGTHLAAASGTLAQYTHTRGLSDKYFSQLVGFYYGQPVESLKQQAYDDILWVVLNCIEGLKTIEVREKMFGNDEWKGEEWKRAWADRALEMYQAADKGWDEKLCGGGMIWSPVSCLSLP
jgi:hypothetical protein